MTPFDLEAGDASADAASAWPRARHGATLAWAVVEGDIVHVSHFAHLPRGRRPDAHCPECGGPVVLKLGRIRSHHVAHAADTVCAAMQPETALHINAKHHVARELRRVLAEGLPVALARPCLAGRLQSRWAEDRPSDVTWEEWEDLPCPATEVTPWAIQWDAVHVEARLTTLESRRVPDILLLQDDRPVAAVEIFVTHRVDDEKARVLANLGVPWLELRAEDVLPPDELSATPGWRASDPLPVFREGPARPWRCPTHQQRFDAWQEGRRRHAEDERERRRHRVEVKALRIVDIMHPSGSHYRRLYRVEEHLTDGVPHTVSLALDEETILSLPFRPDRKADLWYRLRDCCEHDIRQVAARPGTITDCPLPTGQEWLKGPLAARVWHCTEHEVWTRHPLERHYPLRYRLNRAERRWFIPADLRDVSWERPQGDPLEPHPAINRPRPMRKALAVTPTSGWGRLVPTRPVGSPAAGIAPMAAPVATVPGHATRRPSTGAGRRVRVEDFPWVIEEVPGPGYRLFVLPADKTHRETLVGVPHGKVQPDPVYRADQALAASRVPRVWITPAGDWSAYMEGVPWVPITRDADGTLLPATDRWDGPLADFLEALRTGALTADAVISWDERSRLRF